MLGIKTITANFPHGNRKTITRPITQGDYGQQLKFKGIDLSQQAFEIHISNSLDPRTFAKLQVVNNSNTFKIPDEYLVSGQNIYIWVFLHETAEDGQTRYFITIPVEKKPKVSDEPITPQEQSAITQAIAALNDAVAKTGQDVQSADASAQAAANSADQAREYQEETERLKNLAQEFAETASDESQAATQAALAARASANNAENSANNANQRALDAQAFAIGERNGVPVQESDETYNNNSKFYQEKASQYADTASRQTAQAIQAAESAANSQTSAAESAASALTSANNASNSAANASESAAAALSNANAAERMATNSANSALEAKNSENAARSYASDANTSRIAANNSASSALQYATEANTYMRRAGQLAETAGDAAYAAQTAASHYPKVVDGYWYVWDTTTNKYVNSQTKAQGEQGIPGVSPQVNVSKQDHTTTISITDATGTTSAQILDGESIKYHICSSTEYDTETRIPIIQNPEETTFYLVPAEDAIAPDLFSEWVYVNDSWEMFGSARIDLSGYLTDVQINGTSIASDGVADIPMANSLYPGVVKVGHGDGIRVNSHNNNLEVAPADDTSIKTGDGYAPIVPDTQHKSVFYGLASAAGDRTQWQSSNQVGTYTDEAKASIQDMLDVPSKSYVDSTVTNLIDDSSIAGDTAHTWSADKILSQLENNDSIFVCTYNQTTFEQAVAAFNAGKFLICKQSHTGTPTYTTIAVLTSGSNIYNMGFRFESAQDPHLKVSYYRLTSSGWFQSTRPYNDITTIDAAVAEGDYVPYVAADSLNRLVRNENLKFGTSSTQYLANNGTWQDIPETPVQDVQVNDVSVVSNGVANIPVAINNGSLGVVKINADRGIGTFVDGTLAIGYANSNDIKSASSQFKPITPRYQSESTFYGLAQAAGDLTWRQSDNPIGAYTDEAKAAINTMIGSVSKDSLDDAGITTRSYTTKFGGEFTVTTATTSGWSYPYKRASVTGRISKHHMHRVTVNGTEYILPTRLWYSASTGNIKVYEYLGNLGLYKSTISNIPGGTDDVPFCIISDLNNAGSIDVLTEEAGTYTILVEEINNTQKALPKSLIWDDNYQPIEKLNNGGTYNGFSLGVNELSSSRGTFAVGYGNKISAEFANAIGINNTVSGANSIAIGSDNNINAFEGFCIGTEANVSGNDAVAMCYLTKANATNMVAIGKANVEATIPTVSNWAKNTVYHVGDLVNASISGIATITFVCMIDHTSPDVTYINNDSDYLTKWKMAPSNGDTAFVVGNGSTNSRRSNAFKIDWLGNVYANGNVYVNCTSNSTGGSKVATESYVDTQIGTRISDVQLNGTSVVSDGVANIPYATSQVPGVVMIGSGLGVNANNKVTVIPATANEIKTSSTTTNNPIIPARQDASVFYGLAKAAGDTTQAQSSNSVGTYTDSAKASIQSMLGVDQLIAEPETNPASSFHPYMGMFMLDGKLCYAKEDIEAGDTITLGVGGNAKVATTASMIETRLREPSTSGTAGQVLTSDGNGGQTWEDLGVTDVQINGTSVINNGIANLVLSDGLTFDGVNLKTNNAGETGIKAGASSSSMLVPLRQHYTVFYGLSKAAGVDLANEDVTLGTYPDTAKAAIRNMIGVGGDTLIIPVSGTAVTITAENNCRYVCGEVLTIDITAPASGICDIVFTSGSTVAVLTGTGITWPEWFDASTLETNTVYEINIADGRAVIATWPTS